MKRLSLTARMALLLMACTGVPLTLVPVVTYFNARIQLLAGAKSQNLQAAQGTAEGIDLYLESTLNGIRAAAQGVAPARFLAQRGDAGAASDAKVVIETLRRVSGYDAIYLTDPLGTVVLAADARFLGRSYFTARWFRTAAAGQEVVDEFRYDADDQQVYLHFSAPVRNARGVIAGVLVGRVTTAPIDRLIAHDTNYSGRGDNGTLWDDLGIRLSDGGGPAARFRPLGPLTTETREMLSYEGRFGPETAKLLAVDKSASAIVDQSRRLLNDPRSDPYFSLHSEADGSGIASMVPLRNQRWIYGISTPANKVYARVGIIVQRALWLTLLACLVAMGSGVVIARRLLRPIRAVSAAAKGIASGDMTRRAGLIGNDEAAQLAITFDAMADSLVQHAAKLETARERERVEEARRSSDERYRSLIENAAHGICRLSREGRFLAANPALVELLGYDSVDQLTHVSIPQSVCGEWGEFLAIWPLNGGEAKFESSEFVWRCRDGRPISVRLSGRRVPDADACDIIVENVTERRTLEEQVRQSQKMESVGRLAGGVAHDFNNLLTVINGHSAMLLQRLKADDALRANALEIQKAGERAAGLTMQLLAYSRKQVLQPRVLDLNQVTRGMSSMLQRLVGEDVEVCFRLCAEEAIVRADPNQMEQVVMNLAVNSRQAMPRGGKLLIETSFVEWNETNARAHAEMHAGRYVLLSVSDTGVGMDAETQRHIFEPFFTTKGVGEGTGLGLSTVQGIVAQSGGVVHVYSEMGMGTTFKIYLPRVTGAVVEDSTPQTIPSPGTETVLLVEDQVEVREYVSMALESFGYHVIQARSAAEALPIFHRERERVGIVLTDVVMPQGNGRELADQLAAIQPGIRILFMSGYSAEAITQNGALKPGAQFIQKPFSPTELAGKVREVLGAPSVH